jgi:hypothetical protein
MCCAESAFRIGHKSLIEAMPGCVPLAEANWPKLRKKEREKKVFVIVMAVQAHTWRLDWAAIMRPIAAALSGSPYNWLMAVGFLLLAQWI